MVLPIALARPLPRRWNASSVHLRSGGRRVSSPPPAPSLPRAVAQFAAAGLVALAVLAAAGTIVLQRIGAAEALHEAGNTALLEAQALQPDITDALLVGDPAALAAMDRHVHQRVLSERAQRVKIWSPDGRVLYAVNPAVIGQRFPLGADQRAALATGRPMSDLSELTAPENQFDGKTQGRLLEVYQLVHTPSGKPLLFEVYLRYDSVTASGRRIWTSFLPALLVALLALELLQLPLAWRLTRRLQQGQRERDELHRRATEASDAERRRIAADLHDGVVQTLAGVSYSLASAHEEITTRCSPEVARTIDGAADTTRRGIRELRSLLVDIYPPNLREAGLSAALTDLLAPLPARGLSPQLRLTGQLALPDDVEELLYRAAQESVRNVLAHAHAREVEIAVLVDGGLATLEVRDDGRGCAAPEDLDPRPRFGLRLLAEMAAGLNGRLHVDSVPGCGTTLRLEVPVP